MAEPLFLPSSDIGSSLVSFPGYFPPGSPPGTLSRLFSWRSPWRLPEKLSGSPLGSLPVCFSPDCPPDTLSRFLVFHAFSLLILPFLSETFSRSFSPAYFLFLFISSGFFLSLVCISLSFFSRLSLFRLACPPPLFCNLAHLTLLAPSLAHSAIFPAILPVVFSCAASDPPLSFSRYSPSPPRAFPFHAGSMLHLFSSVCDFPSSVHPRFLSSKLPERFPEPLIPVIRGAIQTEI